MSILALETQCAVASCSRKATSKGWCQRHYARWHRHGDPEVVLPCDRTLMERFMEKVHVPIGTSCVEWTAATNAKGYGIFGVYGSRSQLAHRWIYETSVGKVPAGMCLDHLCRNRRCVNVQHMEVVTPQENHRRGLHGELFRVKARPTHCPQGHPYVEGNLVSSQRGYLICRQCNNEKNRAYTKLRRRKQG